MNFTKTIFIVLATVILISSASAVEFQFYTPHQTYSYYLQDVEIVNYTDSGIGLSNSTVVETNSDNANYLLSQITKKNTTSTSKTVYDNSRTYITQIKKSGNYSIYDPNNTVRIEQGDCVTLGETIDISGNGWYTGYLAYFGPYYDGYSSGDNITELKYWLPVKSRNLSKFYIDPDYFYDKPGWWYTWYSSDTSDTTKYGGHGYDRMFYVSDTCKNKNKTEAQTYIDNLTRLYQLKEQNLSELQPKTAFGAQYVVPKNETTILPAPNNTRLWIFGRTNYNYDVETKNGTAEITQHQGVNWESGIYHLLFTKPDGNGIYEQEYTNGFITSPFRNITPVYIEDSQSPLVENTLKNLINTSYQTNYTEYNIALESPSIEIMKFDQWRELNNETLITIAGYTNALPGDTITIQMDKGKIGDWHEIAAHTWNTIAWGNLSEYRRWNTSFVFNVQDEFPQEHNITVSANNGGIATVPIYIYRELLPHYIPENYLQYVNNSPFIPPVYINTTITIPVPGPTQIITVIVTPSDEQVKAQQKIITDENIKIWETRIIVVVGVIGIIWYLVSLYLRRKELGD